jgi:hypothetical protein
MRAVVATLAIALAHVSVAHARGCPERPVVGLTRCAYVWLRSTRGVSAFPMPAVELGVARLAIPTFDLGLNIYSPDGVSLARLQTRARWLTFAFHRERVHVRFGALVAGVEIMWAIDPPAAGTSVALGELQFAPTASSVNALNAVIGLATHDPHVQLGAELAFGFESAEIDTALPPRYSGSPPNENASGNIAVRYAHPLVELRARADVWMSRFVTLGLVGGTNLAQLGEFSIAIAGTFHWRPYDGY